MIGMKCDYCAKQIGEFYLVADRYFFNEHAIGLEQGVFCNKDCFFHQLKEVGAIQDWD